MAEVLLTPPFVAPLTFEALDGPADNDADDDDDDDDDDDGDDAPFDLDLLALMYFSHTSTIAPQHPSSTSSARDTNSHRK